MLPSLIAIAAAICLASLVASRKATTSQVFFGGVDEYGRAPGLASLILSQVTTWIFARSLMNAAILGYFFGIAGALAYTAYYLSFVTGAFIVDGIRNRRRFGSVQDFLGDRFGPAGRRAYDLVVGVRLLSEVFANLIVVGLIFGVAGSAHYIIAVLALGAIGFLYSMLGGLRASIRTDVLQASLLIVVLGAMTVILVTSDGFSVTALLTSSPDADGPGWVLLAVALLQVWSYPMHDPVMMDRGFLADRRTTRRSFVHAGWISMICILAFGLLGVHAGGLRVDDEAMMTTIGRLFGDPMMFLFNVAVIVSAVSTLDSTLSSAAKLTIVDMKLAKPTLGNGRIAMAAFMVGGLAFLFAGSQDLFSAVAVSGTAAMFLTPVVVFSLWWNRRDVPVWSYLVSFAIALAGAGLYFVESSGYIGWVQAVTGYQHKYSQLLAICLVVLAGGMSSFVAGMLTRSASGQRAGLGA